MGGRQGDPAESTRCAPLPPSLRRRHQHGYGHRACHVAYPACFPLLQQFRAIFSQVAPAAHRRIRHVARDSSPEDAVESFHVFFVERTLGKLLCATAVPSRVDCVRDVHETASRWNTPRGSSALRSPLCSPPPSPELSSRLNEVCGPQWSDRGRM
jgi:hypothetical protein